MCAEVAGAFVHLTVTFPAVVVSPAVLTLVFVAPTLGLHADGFSAFCAAASLPILAGASVVCLADDSALTQWGEFFSPVLLRVVRAAVSALDVASLAAVEGAVFSALGPVVFGVRFA